MLYILTTVGILAIKRVKTLSNIIFHVEIVNMS